MLGKVSPWFLTVNLLYFSQLRYLQKYVCISSSNCFLGVLFFLLEQNKDVSVTQLCKIRTSWFAFSCSPNKNCRFHCYPCLESHLFAKSLFIHYGRRKLLMVCGNILQKLSNISC